MMPIPLLFFSAKFSGCTIDRNGSLNASLCPLQNTALHLPTLFVAVAEPLENFFAAYTHEPYSS